MQRLEAAVKRCARIDAGKKFALLRVMISGARASLETQVKKFDAIVSERDRPVIWLVRQGGTQVVMEGTGDYCQPIFKYAR